MISEGNFFVMICLLLAALL